MNRSSDFKLLKKIKKENSKQSVGALGPWVSSVFCFFFNVYMPITPKCKLLLLFYLKKKGLLFKCLTLAA